MKIKNLTFRHSTTTPYFFHDLSFELEEGKIHALHGKNGMGKSVLLHILQQREKRCVLMNQQFDQTVVGPYTFLENLEFGLLPRLPSFFRRRKLSEVPSYFSKLIQRFQIDLTIPVEKLSGGQRQILALLMKLQRLPEVLLLDEPTATLDEQNATMVFEFLQALKGITMLVVCHDQELIRKYATGKHFCLTMGESGARELQELV